MFIFFIADYADGGISQMEFQGVEKDLFEELM
jgi:hypothetical protein